MIKKLLLIACFLVSIFGYSQSNGDFESEITVDCDEAPTNLVWCYEPHETFEVTYTSTVPDNVLNLTINAGEIYAYGDDFIILDSDGTTELYSGKGAGGDLL